MIEIDKINIITTSDQQVYGVKCFLKEIYMHNIFVYCSLQHEQFTLAMQRLIEFYNTAGNCSRAGYRLVKLVSRN